MSRNGWLPYDITKRLLKRFVKHLEEKERADATVKKYQQHIRVLFDEWHKAGHDVVELPGRVCRLRQRYPIVVSYVL